MSGPANDTRRRGRLARLPLWSKVLLAFVVPISVPYGVYWLWRNKMRVRLLLRAALRQEAFSCNALTGDSDYNVCVNSDMTVSCNCQDFDGSGHIGDLRVESLHDIFAGRRVRRFLEMLSRRSFPTSVCPICPELRHVPARTLAETPVVGTAPTRGIMVENTALCNLRCDLCRRDELLSIRRQRSLSIEDIHRVSRVLKDGAIESVYFFNLGEPFIPGDVLDQVRAIRSANPGIRIITSTNGMLLDTPDKIQAALLMDYVYVSLDGVDQDTVTKYQVGGDFERSFDNMRHLIRQRNASGRQAGDVRLPVIEWKYVVFSHNDHPRHIQRAAALAEEIGVDVLGFYAGAAPLWRRSRRYPRNRVFQALGVPAGEGLVVNRAGVPQEVLSP